MKKNFDKTEEDVVRFLKDKTEFERAVLVATFKIPKERLAHTRG